MEMEIQQSKVPLIVAAAISHVIAVICGSEEFHIIAAAMSRQRMWKIIIL